VRPEAKKILVVDDDDEVRSSYRALLEEAGYSVLEAANGTAALHHLTSDEALPDLMVMDLRMPGMTGWDLVRVLARSSTLAALPIVVVSAGEPHLGVLRDLIASFLMKPVEPAALLDMVEVVLKRTAEKKRVDLL
jgi:CheY-like chemotaxis protein